MPNLHCTPPDLHNATGRAARRDVPPFGHVSYAMGRPSIVHCGAHASSGLVVRALPRVRENVERELG